MWGLLETEDGNFNTFYCFLVSVASRIACMMENGNNQGAVVIPFVHLSCVTSCLGMKRNFRAVSESVHTVVGLSCHPLLLSP